MTLDIIIQMKSDFFYCLICFSQEIGDSLYQTLVALLWTDIL